jgi:hypothetical protein
MVLRGGPAEDGETKLLRRDVAKTHWPYFFEIARRSFPRVDLAHAPSKRERLQISPSLRMYYDFLSRRNTFIWWPYGESSPESRFAGTLDGISKSIVTN